MVIILPLALHNILWMFPFTLLPACKQLLGTRGGENLTSMDLMVVAYLVLGEACLIKSLGFPNFPGGLYGISLSCCVVVFFLCRFFVSHF
ncbi:hypothetical protein BGY98DRAFT_997349 [Russula aff. rugulosa BPL654]|nr:hypothetical protein BGY98DRAFT_997349 [Russula aff. rugulosa BPL654]